MSYLHEVKGARVQLSGEVTRDRLDALVIWKAYVTQSPEHSTSEFWNSEAGDEAYLMCSTSSNPWSSPGVINIARPLPTLCPTLPTYTTDARAIP